MNDILQSFLLPLVTGTVAGFLINYILEQSRAKERRYKILSALYAQILALPRINTKNQTATNFSPSPLKHIVPILYPIVPFETAIFSETGISVSEKTIEVTTDYLLKARELNALIGTLQVSHLEPKHGNMESPNKAETQKFLYDQATTEMPKRIETLKTCIENEQKRK